MIYCAAPREYKKPSQILCCILVLSAKLCIADVGSIDTKPLMLESEPPLNFIGYHFPPLSYDPSRSSKQQIGLVREIYYRAFDQLKIRFKARYYPPSRVIKTIADGDTDIIITGKEVALPYHSIYLCGEQALYYLPIVLYQNMGMQPKPYTDVKAQVQKARILVPKESRNVFLRLLHPSNQLQLKVLPRNMANMFAAQREAFMVDYRGRAQWRLKQIDLEFSVTEYWLGEVQTVICINRKVHNARAKINALFHTMRSYKSSAFLQSLESKYKFHLNWESTQPHK